LPTITISQKVGDQKRSPDLKSYPQAESKKLSNPKNPCNALTLDPNPKGLGVREGQLWRCFAPF
jgi:hypothetical protein